jgi:hypothetical protein
MCLIATDSGKRRKKLSWVAFFVFRFPHQGLERTYNHIRVRPQSDASLRELPSKKLEPQA